MGSPNNPGLGRRGLRAALEPRLVVSPVRPRALPTASAKHAIKALKLLSFHRKWFGKEEKENLDDVSKMLQAQQPCHEAQHAMVRRRMQLRSVLTEDET